MLYSIVLFSSFTGEKVELGSFDEIEELSTTFPISINGNDLALYGRNASEWDVAFFRLLSDGTRQELVHDPRVFLEDLACPINFL
jgi:hypothetical protein